MGRQRPDDADIGKAAGAPPPSASPITGRRMLRGLPSSWASEPSRRAHPAVRHANLLGLDDIAAPRPRQDGGFRSTCMVYAGGAT